MKIPLTRPFSDDSEWKAVREVLGSGWWTQGRRVEDLEERVARYVGADAAVACTSCTTALHIAMLLKEVGPGDEVIVPSYTWITTPNVVRMAGATPVFADIGPATFNLDPADAERCITERTKGIIVVHQFGLPADIDAFQEIAERHDLWIVEDAACALGSTYKGRRIGAHSDIVCFSLHPRKVISCGEGGIIAVNGVDFVPLIRSLISHGATVSDRKKDAAAFVPDMAEEEFPVLGYNYRLSDIQAAVAVEQMKKLDDIIERRRRLASRYDQRLGDVPNVVLPTISDDSVFNGQSYAVFLAEDFQGSTAGFAQHLMNAGISCRLGYMACHTQPLYRALYPELVLSNTEAALAKAVILPLYPQMTDAEQDHVVKVFQEGMRLQDV